VKLKELILATTLTLSSCDKAVHNFHDYTSLTIEYSEEITEKFLRNWTDPRVEEYIKQNLNQIMEAHEKKMGIEFIGKPKIQYSLIEERFEGSYGPSKKLISLPSGLLTHPLPDFGDLIIPFLVGKKQLTAISVLDHELGHFYCYERSKKLGYNILNNLGSDVVQEGIAGYFESRTQPNQRSNSNFKDENWPKNMKDFRDYEIYQGGFYLVKPVIDKFKKKGIDYLILHPPTPNDLKNLPRYQKKVLHALEHALDKTNVEKANKN